MRLREMKIIAVRSPGSSSSRPIRSSQYHGCPNLRHPCSSLRIRCSPALGPCLSATVVMYVVLIISPSGFWTTPNKLALIWLARGRQAHLIHVYPKSPRAAPVPRIQPEPKVLESIWPDWSLVRSTMWFNRFMEGRYASRTVGAGV